MASPPRAPADPRRLRLAELRETLRRQERLSRNEKFICKLPDKGKKILDHVAKLKATIAEHELVRGKSELFDPTNLDSELRQKAPVVDRDTDQAGNSNQILSESSLVPGHTSVKSTTALKTPTHPQALGQPASRGEETEIENPVSHHPASSGGANVPSSAAFEHLSGQSASDQAEDKSSSLENQFIDRLQKITIADEHQSEENTNTENLTGLGSRTQKKPHFMEVLEMRAQNPVPTPHKFKTNVLPSQHTSSSSHCQGRGSPVSLEERRRRDKQHLDDITAARLLPLHHMPAQLLSIEESLTLQKQQKQNYEEMQAKLAAQKLAERLNIKMQDYNPEGDTSKKYREVRDEDDQSSDEF
ncbi:protein GRINL1A [Sorex fumeus]|uniref:protein GRINL1A n=1 Tax=Sorex fumeus TaxID=62283 RepID=UPI0024AD5A5A|nr:protein GRINL1A [Sorex fumeus]